MLTRSSTSVTFFLFNLSFSWFGLRERTEYFPKGFVWFPIQLQREQINRICLSESSAPVESEIKRKMGREENKSSRQFICSETHGQLKTQTNRIINMRNDQYWFVVEPWWLPWKIASDRLYSCKQHCYIMLWCEVVGNMLWKTENYWIKW